MDMLEAVVRPFQILPGPRKIPVAATSTDGGKATVTEATPADGGGGTGYAIDDTIIIDGGAGTAAILRVRSIISSTGAVTEVSIDSAGSYALFPDSPAGQRSTTGAGSGATFNLTSSAADAAPVTMTWGAVGKLPSPVSDAIGISICQEKWDETGRVTEDVKVQQEGKPQNYVIVRRTKVMKINKAESKDALRSSYTSYVNQAFEDFDAQFAEFDKSDDTQQGKCNVTANFKNNQGTT